MAEKLFIADKKTLDEVNKNIQENANFIKQQFPISNGIDWSKYNNGFSDEKTIINTPAEELTIVDIKGGGYLTNFSIGYGSGDTEDTDVEIIIDNKVIYTSKIKKYDPPNSDYYSITLVCSFSNYRANDYSIPKSFSNFNQGYIYIPQPLFFNKSLVIKLKKVSAYRINYQYGGVIKA